LGIEFSDIRPVSGCSALLLTHGDERALVIGDLHIGWEVALAQQGIHIPSQTERLAVKLREVIQDSRPDTLIFIGDVKHAVTKVELEEWRDIPRFFEEVLKQVADVRVVLGNHDGNLDALTPPSIRLVPSSGMVWHDVGILHGHAWPGPEILACENLVMGHVHPVVVFRDSLGFRTVKQVWVKTKCNAEGLAMGSLKKASSKADRALDNLFQEMIGRKPRDQNVIIMPSFNDFLSGATINKEVLRRARDVTDEYSGPILRSGALDIENAEIFLMDGTFLGKNSQLRKYA